jgi:primosomal protein N' (replication factor Y)
LRHEDYNLLRHASHALAEVMRKKFGERVMGPVSAALEMLRGEHRAEIILKIEVGASMQRARTLLGEAIKTVETDTRYKTVKIAVDVDAL